MSFTTEYLKNTIGDYIANDLMHDYDSLEGIIKSQGTISKPNVIKTTIKDFLEESGFCYVSLDEDAAQIDNFSPLTDGSISADYLFNAEISMYEGGYRKGHDIDSIYHETIPLRCEFVTTIEDLEESNYERSQSGAVDLCFKSICYNLNP